jgi:hypothetical protein
MQNTTSYKQQEVPPPDMGSACPEGNHGGMCDSAQGGPAQVYSGGAGWQDANSKDANWRDGTPEFQGSNVDTAPVSTPFGASDNFTGGGQLKGD